MKILGRDGVATSKRLSKRDVVIPDKTAPLQYVGVKLATLFLGVTIVGCLPPRSSTVDARIDERLVRLELINEDADVGENVALIASSCSRGPVPLRSNRPRSRNCKKRIRSVGKVIRTLGQHQVIAEFPAGIKIEAGDAVQVITASETSIPASEPAEG